MSNVADYSFLLTVYGVRACDKNLVMFKVHRQVCTAFLWTPVVPQLATNGRGTQQQSVRIYPLHCGV